jgi:isopenicillin-N N-acyltransferase-like protein
MANSTVTKLILAGDAYERGRQHGSQARAKVHLGVEYYKRMWLDNLGGSVEELLTKAAQFEPVVGDFDAQILEELQGIADGAELTLREILLLNARYELMLEAVFTKDPPLAAGECTSLAAEPVATSDGHTLLAQNWDWGVEVGKHCVLLEIQQEDRPDILTHVEAGFVGHKGLNSAGVGLCVNAMSSQHDRFRPGVPVWALARSVLNCKSLDEAQAKVASADRAASMNFMVAEKSGRIAAMEVTPTDVCALPASSGRLSHCNVFADLDPKRGLEDCLAIRYPLFCTRANRAQQLIQKQDEVSLESFKSLLCDHANRPESICRHAHDQPADAFVMQTLASVVMDLTAGVLHLADGSPCTNQYIEHRLSRVEAPK